MKNKENFPKLMTMQAGINVQAGKFPKINKRAGWNKAVQVGTFKKNSTMKNKFSG